MDRETGFYWVKIKSDLGTEWEELQIGKYIGNSEWELTRSVASFYDEELLILSDKLEEPDEHRSPGEAG